jgi:hypothetical protein
MNTTTETTMISRPTPNRLIDYQGDALRLLRMRSVSTDAGHGPSYYYTKSVGQVLPKEIKSPSLWSSSGRHLFCWTRYVVWEWHNPHILSLSTTHQRVFGWVQRWGLQNVRIMLFPYNASCYVLPFTPLPGTRGVHHTYYTYHTRT